MTYSVHAQIITQRDAIVEVVKDFKSEAARTRWLDKVEESGRLVQVLGFREAE